MDGGPRQYGGGKGRGFRKYLHHEPTDVTDVDVTLTGTGLD